MPTKLDRCVEEVKKQGKSESSAWAICHAALDEIFSDCGFVDAEYKGRKVTLNKPFRTPGSSSKFGVYVKNNNDNIILVRFGDPKMEIKRDDPERRKAFRERHNCENKNDKTKAGYWSCKFWSSSKVSELIDEESKPMLFSDNIKITFDEQGKRLISVRDGFQEYAGIELGLQPYDKTFKVYRSPETIRAIINQLSNIPVTDGHVELEDIPANKVKGFITDSSIVKYDNKDTASTIAIKNNVKLQDNVIQLLDSKKELSLGYFAETKEHDLYDFEQVNIIPHHLAIVENGRCGSVCKFRDERKDMDPKDAENKDATESTESKVTDAGGENPVEETKDAEAPVNLQRIAEVVKDLPEAVKLMSLEELTALVPVLESAISTARAATPNGQEATQGTEMEGAEEAETEQPAEEVSDEEGNPTSKEDEKTDFKDSKEFKDAVMSMSDERVNVILKAKKFLDEKYDFKNTCTTQIMKDTLATQSKESFKDEEVGVAFKMLKKLENYSKFADNKAKNEWDEIKDKEI